LKKISKINHGATLSLKEFHCFVSVELPLEIGSGCNKLCVTPCLKNK